MAARNLDGIAGGGPVLRISAGVVEASQRARFVAEEISSRLTDVRAEAFPDTVPQFDYKLLAVGPGARIVDATLAGLDVERSRHHLADGDDNFTLFIALAGDLLIEQGDRRLVVRRGGAGLLNNSRPFLTRFPATKFCMLQVPRAAFAAASGRCDLLQDHADRQRIGLLRAYMHAVFRAADHGHVPAVAALHLQELAAASFVPADRPHDRGTAMPAGRVAAMRQIMVARHADPTLGMRAVAGEIGISERSGYLAFAALEASFCDELAAIRLDRAIVRLQGGTARIVDIALDVGFGDLSHFNRRFRERFGMTPSEARRANPG